LDEHDRLPFEVWFWEVARVVNETDRDHTLVFYTVKESLLRPGTVHKNLDDIMANVTTIELEFAPATTSLTVDELSRSWGLILRKARRLKAFHLKTCGLWPRDWVRVSTGVLEGQHWPHLDNFCLAGPITIDVVKKFLSTNQKSLSRVSMPCLFDSRLCALDLVAFLNFLKTLLLDEAAILVPKGIGFSRQCRHLDEWTAIVNNLVYRDALAESFKFYNVGFHVLQPHKSYYDKNLRCWRVNLAVGENAA